MVLDEELTIAVLNQNESLLGFLDPDQVEIEEGYELYKIRTLTITHPMMDKHSNDDTKYTDILTEGNKLWRTLTCDGVPILYVILGKPTINYEDHTIKVYAEEVATELSQLPPVRNTAFSWTVNSSFISTYFGDYFDTGTLTGPGTTTATSYNGTLTPMEILRQIEEQTGGEFQFRYEYNTGVIKRYIDYHTTIGITHTQKIDLSTNALSFDVSIDESDTRIAAAPIGKPSSDTDTFHQNMKAFEDLVVSTSTPIPLYVTKDESGNPVNGPNTNPPYDKGAGQTYVSCTDVGDIVANYNYVYGKEGSLTGTPRVHTFTTSESNPYNIYWECVDYIRQYLEPEINIDCKVVDLNKLQDEAPEYYNTGDTVYLELPIYGTVSARIMETSKDPRRLDEDTVHIGNYQTSFLQRNYRSAGMINL